MNYKLQHVSIKGLFGNRNVDFPITDNKLILIAENGTGKTTILNMIFLFLSKQWLKLIQYPFDEMKLKINDEEILFNKEKFLEQKLNDVDQNAILKLYPTYETALNEIFKYNVASITLQTIQFILKIRNFNTGSAEVILDDIQKQLGENGGLSNFSFEPILYMPTYRRIERELDLLGISSFSKIRSMGMGRYLEFFEFGTNDVLNRIFDLLSVNDADKAIEQNVKRKTKALELIPVFLEKCNQYFGESKLIFNEIEKEFRIKLKDQEEMYLSFLSSGEKQILSFFFYLYFFDLEASPFMIIDEPELSISIDWQERLLKDLLESNCSGLLVTTHSPFIVSDSLKEYTEGLNRYMAEEKA